MAWHLMNESSRRKWDNLPSQPMLKRRSKERFQHPQTNPWTLPYPRAAVAKRSKSAINRTQPDTSWSTCKLLSPQPKQKQAQMCMDCRQTPRTRHRTYSPCIALSRSSIPSTRATRKVQSSQRDTQMPTLCTSNTTRWGQIWVSLPKRNNQCLK